MYYQWPVTPPILDDPIVDSDEEKLRYEWYYGNESGGYKVAFGKHKGQEVHKIDISYLFDFCTRVGIPGRRLAEALPAINTFYEGLEQHAQTDYEDFIVPFGRKHRGKRIGQCRDKLWFRWTLTRRKLTEKYAIYFVAVKHFLDNPRHQEVHRDIGELLAETEYEDDLGSAEDVSEEDDVATQSDLDFIDDSEQIQDPQSESDEEAETTGGDDEDENVKEAEVASERGSKKKRQKGKLGLSGKYITRLRRQNLSGGVDDMQGSSSMGEDQVQPATPNRKIRHKPESSLKVEATDTSNELKVKTYKRGKRNATCLATPPAVCEDEKWNPRTPPNHRHTPGRSKMGQMKARRHTRDDSDAELSEDISPSSKTLKTPSQHRARRRRAVIESTPDPESNNDQRATSNSGQGNKPKTRPSVSPANSIDEEEVLKTPGKRAKRYMVESDSESGSRSGGEGKRRSYKGPATSLATPTRKRRRLSEDVRQVSVRASQTHST